MHVRTLNPLSRETYHAICKNLTGYISGGTSVDRVAARVGRAADLLPDMRESCRRMRDEDEGISDSKGIKGSQLNWDWERIEAVSGELAEVPFRAPIHEFEELWQDLDVSSGRILSSDNAIRMRRRSGDLVGDHLTPLSCVQPPERLDEFHPVQKVSTDRQPQRVSGRVGRENH